MNLQKNPTRSSLNKMDLLLWAVVASCCATAALFPGSVKVLLFSFFVVFNPLICAFGVNLRCFARISVLLAVTVMRLEPLFH